MMMVIRLQLPEERVTTTTKRVALQHVATILVLLLLLLVQECESFSSTRRAHLKCHSSSSPSQPPLYSTPFEADYYESDNPYEDDLQQASSSLAVPPDTKLVLGLCKYSHDTALCAANADTGQVLFALEKERLTRTKHDGGNVAVLVERCLEALSLHLDSVEKVVVNNHHFRVLPLERNLAHMEWECGLNINGGAEIGYEEEENIFLGLTVEKHELSHHLAHAYSTATQAPFDSGMIIVMDGMGETYRTMLEAVKTGDKTYTSDLTLLGGTSFECIPSDLKERCQYSRFDWREAESVYTFKKNENGIDIRPVFKRFIEERTPPTLYNHGFENMDSVGALYSRASSHIFGDWNACGKVMGLAPWIGHSWTTQDGKRLGPTDNNSRIMWGTLYSEGEDMFQVDKSSMMGMPYAVRSDPDLFDDEGNMIRKRRYDFDQDADDGSSMDGDETLRLPTKVALEAISLASRVQVDLEDILMDFVKHFKEKTGEKNVCLAGGVALNSVLNGRLCRELGFEKTFISPYPGDEGIAVGCCAFGLYGNMETSEGTTKSPKVWTEPLSPYLGPDPTEKQIKLAIEAASPWLEVDVVRNVERRFEIMAQELESGGVVAWYHGRSEVGPRALGHRSILADPRKRGLVRFINEKVKKRESFRPFAPSVLAEEAAKWFDLGDFVEDANISPYMSQTAYVRESKRNQIPAVTHVDGSSRLQTVTRNAEPLYHQLISAFFKLTGVPMVLNTSFNTLPGEPIVESPQDAIRSFLCSMGAIEMLVMGDYIVKRKDANVRSLLGEASKDGDLLKEPSYPKRAGPVTFESSFSIDAGETDEESVITVTRVRMPDRPMHNEKEKAFELFDELEGELLAICDGTVVMNEILAQYTAMPEDQERSKELMEENKNLIQNIVQRLVRLYEYTFISW